MNKSAATAKVKKGGSSKRPSAAGRPSSSGRRTASRGRASVNRRRSTATRRKGGRKQAVEKELPTWAHWLYVILIASAAVFMAWILLIRPYSYRWKPCYGSKEYEVCMPAGYGLYGMDVSHHQGTIDWTKVAASVTGEFPLSFVIVKATEGKGFLDENLASNRAGAREAGLAFGAYLFYDPSDTPQSQAEFFIGNVPLRAGDLPPVVDVEKRAGSAESFQQNLLACLRILESHYGVKPVIYASYKFRKRYLTSDEFDAYPFWVAHYYVDEPCDDGTAWDLWQFTDRGRVPGIRGNTDLDVFAGTSADFHKLLVTAPPSEK